MLGDGRDYVAAVDDKLPRPRGARRGLACLDVAELFEIGPGPQHVAAVDEAVGVVVVVAAQDDVDLVADILGQLVVVWLTHVGEGNDQIGAVGAQLWDEFLGGLGSRPVDEVGRQGVDGLEPLALPEADDADLQAVAGSDHVSALCVADGDIGAEGRVQYVGNEPGESALGGEVAKLADAEVEIMVAEAGTVGAESVENRDHVAPLGYGALQAGVEGIAGEEGEAGGLAVEAVALLVLVADSHEPGNATHRLSRGRIEVVDIIVVKQSQVGRAG